MELGVHDIVPVKTSRSVAKIADDKKGRQKIERLNKISKEAAKPVSYTHLDVYKRQV